jgi:hypothetical protein
MLIKILVALSVIGATVNASSSQFPYHDILNQLESAKGKLVFKDISTAKLKCLQFREEEASGTSCNLIAIELFSQANGPLFPAKSLGYFPDTNCLSSIPHNTDVLEFKYDKNKMVYSNNTDKVKSIFATDGTYIFYHTIATEIHNSSEDGFWVNEIDVAGYCWQN